jgi:hypothetical protein
VWLLTLVVLVLLMVLRLLRKRRRLVRLADSPLAGIDTGLRSPFRAPVRFPKGF